ncbi:MAG: DM13 domain-containing protein [Nitrosopumilus sp.]
MSTNFKSQENILKVSLAKRIQIGAVSGLIGGSGIFFIIFIIDFHLGLIPGTFYKLVGFPIGLEGISATLFGLISHMFTASLIGAVFCVCSGLDKKLKLSDPNKGIFAGGVTGAVVYSVFFIPITLLVILPLIENGTQNELGLITTFSNIESVYLLQNLALIVLGSLIIHILFGSIMGLTASLFIKQADKAAPRLNQGKTFTKILLVIIAGTIGMGIFYGIVANDNNISDKLPQSELSEELSKIRSDLNYAKFIGMSEDDRLAIVTQMSPQSKELVLMEAGKFDKIIDEGINQIAYNMESPNDLKFIQSAQISGIKGNDAQGKASIVSNGFLTYLRLDDFAVIPGIDQHIYFTKFGDVENSLDIGMLKANKGNQNYPIYGVNSNEYNQMVIYSKPFDVYYATANLQK